MKGSMRRLLSALGAAVAMLGALATSQPASAINVICMDDPPVHLLSPAGNPIEINNYVIYSPSDRHLAHHAQVFGYTEPDGHGGTLAHVFVFLPGGGNESVSVHSVNHQTQSASEGKAGWGGFTEVDVDVPIA
jgi:hypothetical protein